MYVINLVIIAQVLYVSTELYKKVFNLLLGVNQYSEIRCVIGSKPGYSNLLNDLIL